MPLSLLHINCGLVCHRWWMHGRSLSEFLHAKSVSSLCGGMVLCPTKAKEHFHANHKKGGHMKFSQPVGLAAVKCTTTKYRREDRQNIAYIHSDER